MGLIEQDSSKEFETITPLVPQLGTKNRPKRQLHEQLHSHEKVPPSRTYRPPRPFESTPLPHRRIGLTEIHSSQFSTTRRSR